MAGFWAEILAFPTVLYTGALGVASLYWVMVILGALDMDMIDVGGDADALFEGAAEGAGEAAAEAAGEAAAEAVGEAAGEAAAEGAAEAAGDAAAEGALDAEGGHGSWLGGILASLGLRAVPFTFTLSVLALWGWILSYLGMHFLGGVWPFPAWLLSGLVLPLSFAGSLPLTALCIRPLAGLFRTHEATSKLAFIGKGCRVSTASVDERYGQATLEDGGAGLILQVRYAGAATVRKGDHAVLVDYDHRRDVYLIEPVETSDEAGQSEAPSRAPIRPRDPMRS